MKKSIIAAGFCAAFLTFGLSTTAMAEGDAVTGYDIVTAHSSSSTNSIWLPLLLLTLVVVIGD